ncbi:Similar to rtn1-a: Reticulon-1-A (Xenopus laevis) [Cotesia congregata]|uniref:Reticulon-like protein n=1 Tax=Cotesia congregata TaxID=51543 RepID=A0A8J2HK15_COTCN|nr:Similar to rtn1-a: Reticulon-1-A (Xenopus laevis) [Cotesia congregata]
MEMDKEVQGIEKIKRETDSTDDFEHLEHLASPDDSKDSGINIMDSHGPKDLMEVATKLTERNLLDTTVTEVEDKILQPVPATPPPSADLEKFSGLSPSAQPLDPFEILQQQQQQQQQQHNQQQQPSQVDTKTATMAFMETERSGSGFYQDTPEMSPEFGRKEFDSYKNNNQDKDLEDNQDSVKDLLNRDSPLMGGSDSPAASISPDLVIEKETKHNDNYDLGEADDLSDKHKQHIGSDLSPPDSLSSSSFNNDSFVNNKPTKDTDQDYGKKDVFHQPDDDIIGDIKSSVLPQPEKPPVMDFLSDEPLPQFNENSVKEKEVVKNSNNPVIDLHDDYSIDNAPTKPLPPLPKEDPDDKFEMTRDYMSMESHQLNTQADNETGDSEFESEPEPSPAKVPVKPSVSSAEAITQERKFTSSLPAKKYLVEHDEIAPRKIFSDMGLDAWFNPERLNPKVAALIYWRQPEKTGIVFGVVMSILLSLTYFSLISVFSYTALLTLVGTMGFRIYKTVLQAIQKTSDGHPFKDILEVDLTLPAEKVHEVADIAVAHANAAVSELRRLFLIEDFIDSLKFSIGLWCLTYVGSWFNGMTLIIIGVIALFTLPKVYETNKAQIDQNLALVQGKINELTAKIKAAIPLGKKAEPTKEE